MIASYLLLLAAAAATPAPGKFAEGSPYPIIDSHPPKTVAITTTASCAGGGPIEVRVSQDEQGVSVQSLSASNRTLGPDLLRQWNSWLQPLVSLRAVSVQCTEGAVIFISGSETPTGPTVMVVVGWVPSGLYRM